MKAFRDLLLSVCITMFTIVGLCAAGAFILIVMDCAKRLQHGG